MTETTPHYRKPGRVTQHVFNPLIDEGRPYLVSPRGEGQWVRNVRAADGRLATIVGRRRDEWVAHEMADTAEHVAEDQQEHRPGDRADHEELRGAQELVHRPPGHGHGGGDRAGGVLGRLDAAAELAVGTCA